MKITSNGKYEKKRGFTLIELLIVIAIIAILAAILFPVFARARENARRSSCASNMKQMGLGIMQYSQDYDERMPQVYSGGIAWQENIQPYVTSVQIFRCPAINNVTSSIAAVSSAYSGKIKNHYLCNGNNNLGSNAHTDFRFRRPMDATDNSGSDYVATALAEIRSPSQCLMVAEYSGGSNRTSANVYNGQNSAGGMDSTNHLATTNYLFADGHVKSLKPSATFTGGVNMWANNPAQGDTGNLRNGLAYQDATLQ